MRNRKLRCTWGRLHSSELWHVNPPEQKTSFRVDLRKYELNVTVLVRTNKTFSLLYVDKFTFSLLQKEIGLKHECERTSRHKCKVSEVSALSLVQFLLVLFSLVHSPCIQSVMDSSLSADSHVWCVKLFVLPSLINLSCFYKLNLFLCT